MRHHALEIHVQPDNTALCFISSPTYGDAALNTRNSCQQVTLNDGENRVKVAVFHRKISVADIRRIARDAVDRNFDASA